MTQNLLRGRIAIVTGASQGLGLEIARTYIGAGADVMLCARDGALVADVRDRLRLAAAPGQQVLACRADVAEPADVEALVAQTLDQLGGCHILVNNAGVYGPKGAIEDVDWDEWTRALAINVNGSVLTCRALLPHFRQQGYGKIIQLSGGGATAPLPRLSSYAVSKAAIVRFAETLAEEVRGTGIDVNAIAPGALNTRLLDEILEAGPEKVGADFHARAVAQKQSGGAGLERGAELALFLASAASDGITGKLISALWDAWDAWPAHLDELARSDAWTLRRVTGRDRGFDWGDK